MSIESPNFREPKIHLIEEARQILEKKTRAGPREKFELAKKLKATGEFGYARKLLARARKVFIQDPVFRIILRQQHALCTYKDPNLTLNDRLDRALEILSEEEDLTTTRNQETLGLAGAIHKRKWEADSQKQNLERSLAFYLRGYDEDPTYDFGYTGINAAFVLDKLAALEGSGTTQDDASDVASTRRAQARDIRQRLVAILPKLLEENEWLRSMWWVHVTVVEAYFGLKDYPNARIWMERAKQLLPEHWEFESTARQLVNLALLQLNEQDNTTGAPVWEELENGEAGALLRDFLAGEVTSIRSLIIGKVGLALAGGGFRAALFHIGVLAKLAELDVLRNVEVLSCVSGGAIIGTHYYLELRRLLESKGDEAITRDDYVALVQKLERDFLAGVQGNIRMRATASLTNGLRSLFRRDYSRSERLGRLLESELFARVDDGNNEKRRFLNELLIRPLNASEGFTPQGDNWRRAAKVPILVLNSTTLNTGHNWQFTASWMGETPAGINREIDANDYLRQMYYAEAPLVHQKMPLGRAVAASTCIPGLCEPIVLADLYPEMTVRLVDGGVHGSQGVTALLEQDCNVLLVCDATGEIETQKQPGSGLLEVPLRSSNIALTQTRALLYEKLKARRQSNLLRGLMYVHLMKDLDAETVNWIGCDEPKSLDEDGVPLARRGPLTRYGIRKDVQASLAAIRTDLDSFSDVEAFALMTCGYRMTEYEFPKFIQGFSAVEPVRPSWRFLALEEPMKRAGNVEQINGTLQLLNVASNRGFKVWRLSRLAQSIAMTLSALVILAVVYLTYKFGGAFAFQVNLGRLLFLLVAISILLLVAKIVLVVGKIQKTLTEIAMDFGLMISGLIPFTCDLELLTGLNLSCLLKCLSRNRLPRPLPAYSREPLKQPKMLATFSSKAGPARR